MSRLQEIHIGYSWLKKLTEKLRLTPKVIVDAEKEAIAAAAPKMKAIVDREIGGSGKVRSWQGQYVGSKGLYAAVRPKRKTWTEATKKKGNRYAVGYVTNAINSGHRFPPPSGRKYYKPKIMSGKMTVEGKGFYPRADAQMDRVVREVADQIGQAWQAFWEDRA